MKTKSLLAAAIVAVAFISTARAEGILDQQLGPAPADAKKDTAMPPKPAAPNASAQPIVPELVDPKSAKIIDDADLVKKLTNSANGGTPLDQGTAAAAMKNMVDHMDQSKTRLTSSDTGAVTQETQRRITTDLDVLIEYARCQQQNGPSQNKPDDQQGQKRQQGGNQKQGPSHEGGTRSATDENQRGGGALTPESNGNDIHQKGPSEWGNLPGKDRDLVSNGVNEQYLPAYKEMIDRYYQALAEIGKPKDH